jgi:hypothetical protein
MGIRFNCPNGHRLNVKPFLAGKRAVCPKCGAKFRVPVVSQNVTVDFDDSPDGPQPGSDERHDRANRYNGNTQVPGDFAGLEAGLDADWPVGDLAAEDDLFGDEMALGGPLPEDTSLNDAAFREDPLTNAALTDAAFVDSALGDPSQSESTRRKAPRGEPTPAAQTPRAPGNAPPLPKKGSPSRPSSADPRGRKSVNPGPVFQAMSGPAVDEVIAAAAAVPRPAPPPTTTPARPEDLDPVLRFRLQRERRNRIMMLLTAILVVLVIVLTIVLVVVLVNQEPETPPGESTPAAKPSTGGAATMPNRPGALGQSDHLLWRRWSV